MTFLKSNFKGRKKPQMSAWQENPLQQQLELQHQEHQYNPHAYQHHQHNQVQDSIAASHESNSNNPNNKQADLPLQTTSPTRASSPGITSLTPRELSEFVIDGRFSKIPPYELAPKDVFSSASHVSVHLTLARTLFVANGAVEGRLEIVCSKESPYCKIGRIQVFLVGIEETLNNKSRKHNQRLFLSKRLTLQDTTRAPSDAVYAGNCDEHGMWKAKQGTTVFDFTIPIQSNGTTMQNATSWQILTEQSVDGPLPSSWWSKRSGGIRYIVAGVVYTKYGLKTLPAIAAYRDALVIESVPFHLTPSFSAMLPPTSTFIKEATEKIKRNIFNIGKKGTIKLIASVRVPQVDTVCDSGVWVSGGLGFVGVEIKNASARSIPELSITLIRRIKTFSQDTSTPAKASLKQDGSQTSLQNTEAGCSLTPISFVRDAIAKRVLKSAKTPFTSGRLILSTKFMGGGAAEDDYILDQDVRGEKGYEIWSGVAPGNDFSMVLDLNIPVSISPSGCAPIEVEIPVTILHPASLYDNVPPMRLNITDAHSNFEPSGFRLVQEPSAVLTKDDTFVTPSERESTTDFLGVVASNLATAPRPPPPTEKSEPVHLREDLMKNRYHTISNRSSLPTKIAPLSVSPSRSATINSKRNSVLGALSAQMAPTTYLDGPDILSSQFIPAPPTMPPAMLAKQQGFVAPVPAVPVSRVGVNHASLARPPPPPPPPPAAAGNNASNAQVIRSKDLSSADSLDGVPRMDLVQEIDKLFACVPVE
eukprot:jgi/Hompol1/6205/HPOL_004875-RA